MAHACAQYALIQAHLLASTPVGKPHSSFQHLVCTVGEADLRHKGLALEAITDTQCPQHLGVAVSRTRGILAIMRSVRDCCMKVMLGGGLQPGNFESLLLGPPLAAQVLGQAWRLYICLQSKLHVAPS
eukprot:1158429-Pelagomonas_calceolata.AAC.5